MKEIKRESYKRDSVDYVLIASKENGIFWGEWHCLNCNIKGASSIQTNSPSDAIEAAKSTLSGHHYPAHVQSKT